MFENRSHYVFDDDIPDSLRPLPPDDIDRIASSVRGFGTDVERWRSVPIRDLFWINHFLEQGWNIWYQTLALKQGYRAHITFDYVLGYWVWHGLERLNSLNGKEHVEKMNSFGQPIRDFIRKRVHNKNKKIFFRLPENIMDVLEGRGRRS